MRARRRARRRRCRIALVGKYVALEDAYKSVSEALRHAGFAHGGEIEIDWVDSETLDSDEARRAARRTPTASSSPAASAAAASRARSARRASPASAGSRTSAICLGMQIAVCEFARHVAGMDGANSTEFDIETRVAGDRPAARAEGGLRPRRHDAPRRRPGQAPRGHARPRALRRGRHLRAPPPPLRGHISLRKRLEAAGLVVSGTSPDERLVEVDRAAATTRSSSPRSTTPSSSRGPSARRRCSGSSSRAALERARDRRPRATSARRRRREPAAPRVSASRGAPRPRSSAGALNELFARAVRDRVALRPRARGAPTAWPRELRALGLAVEEDEPAATPAGDARQPARAGIAGGGRERRSVLLCAHLDTVPHEGPVEPVLVDGGWESAGDTILGADNKAAVAVCCSPPGAPRVESRRRSGVELLFTVERGDGAGRRQGVRRLPAAQPRSATSSTTRRRSARSSWPRRPTTAWRPSFRGRAAHAGIRPEDGRSAIVAAARAIAAMPPRPPRRGDHGERRPHRGRRGRDQHRRRALHGRWPRRARSTAAKVEAVVAEIVDHSTTPPTSRVRVRRRRRSSSACSRATARSRASRRSLAAERALRACGYTPRHIVTGGGIRRQRVEAAGFRRCEPRQRDRAQPRADRARQRAALEGMLDVTYALLDVVAAG